ncbi:Ig-like domain-containing protein [Psychrosphaera sp. B3R10]|uniref:Ig-like domain-containing protein n=1 Tax=unclassified Psychrosphaera TaxID=2641570 RepID=UPI001C09FEF5|nr:MULTISPECIES: Ig-like domain-containing protein [unclassified Psychrosphaera]MBU2880537.1 Ig-like domain-containing protein [Psychrosphaera sp. I2R16]MBU2989142.1 Ig-like domain-containing protein [Psychrosphaera sp. B3R10]
MVNLKLLFVLFFTSILFGCSDTETSTADLEVTGTNGILSVTLTNSEDTSANIISLGASAIIKVKLTNADKGVITNHAIEFSSNKGTASSDARLTGSDGTTEFVVDTTGISTGIVTATISTTVDEEVLQTDILFEVVDATTVVVEEDSFNIALSIVDSTGIVTNRIREQNSAQLQATLTDKDNAPIVDTPVFFTAELGALQAPSALTNSNGIATVSLTTDTTLGAGFASAQAEVNSVSNSDSIAYEVIAGVNVESVNLGYFDDSNTFILDQFKPDPSLETPATINAGATLGIEFSIVDDAHELITDSITASFTSTCAANDKASIDTAITSVKGTFKATYKDISCAGNSGNVDTIIATITVNSKDYVITHDITLLPEGLGSIEFVSASPESIVIKGAGGQGQQEFSTITFLVRGELGNPIEQQRVEFSLTSKVGDIKLVNDSGTTNSNGLVSAIVLSGTVPTSVRVNATVALENDINISTQSDLLSINTGLPDQDSFTIAFSETNPEARNIVGKQVIVSAYLADSFNNPIPDGTTINFTTEGGAIESHCNTINGKCSVMWTSQEPFLDNHRATILAYAIGHETFFDVNGDNIMGDADGTVANNLIGNMDAVDSGFQRPDTQLTSGFIDLQDAWRDDNENMLYDSGEKFFDYNSNAAHDIGDGYFNGPHCNSTTLCSDDANKLIHIRRAGVLITSSSNAYLKVTQLSNDAVLAQNYGNESISSSTAIARNDFASYKLAISDNAMQTMAVGTQISVTTTAGELSGTTQLRIADTVGTLDPDGYGGAFMTFTLKNNVGETDTAEVSIEVVAPSGTSTNTSFTVALD